MCGRFTDHLTWSEIVELYRIHDQPPPNNMRPRYNIAPTTPVKVVREQDGERDLKMMRWWLVPFWSKELQSRWPMFNAKAETVPEKPAFREAYKRRRALIPASGFFEFKGEKGKKQPYYITRADGQPMTFAGLWESWKSPEGETVLSCTIITTDPNEAMEPIHNRMPVILDGDELDAWLAEPDHDLLKPCSSELLKVFPVRKGVGNVKNDEPENIEPIEFE